MVSEFYTQPVSFRGGFLVDFQDHLFSVRSKAFCFFLWQHHVLHTGSSPKPNLIFPSMPQSWPLLLHSYSSSPPSPNCKSSLRPGVSSLHRLHQLCPYELLPAFILTAPVLVKSSSQWCRLSAPPAIALADCGPLHCQPHLLAGLFPGSLSCSFMAMCVPTHLSS